MADGVTIDNEVYYIENKTDEMERILTDSPIIAEINGKDKVIGLITYNQNRSGTKRFYGDIELTDEFISYNKVEVIRHQMTYKFVTEDSVHVTGIFTYVKKVD